MTSIARLSAVAKKSKTLVSLVRQLRFERCNLQWRLQQLAVTPRAAPREVKRLLALCSDPWQLVGSKGDEAMLTSCVARFAAREPALQVGVLTAAPEAEQAARRLGYDALPVWRRPWKLRDVIRAIEDWNADALIVLGADVMDGYYDPVSALQMIAIADLVARRGVPSAILGFSFNAHPHPSLRTVWKRTTPALHVNVRDPESLERFCSFAGRSARLVADAAFMLEPAPAPPPELERWLARRRAQGDRILAFNVHPHLIRHASQAQLDALAANAAAALRIVLQRRPISLLLLGHDYRPLDRDDLCLQPLAAALAAEFGDRIAYPAEPMSAAELKRIASRMDGVIAGRMHLVIASLGSGVPVMALTYQDKFQGLFQHFALPDSLLFAPQDMHEAARFADRIDDFVLGLDAFRRSVHEALPRVLRASEANLNGILPQAHLAAGDA